MSKLTKRLVILATAMVMVLASSLTVFAKENEAVPRIVDNVMYVDEGSNNVWIYGVAVSIAGANKTDIVPNNPSKKVDVMANGRVFKQLDGVVLLKDEKKDRVFLEAGSVVIEAPTITDKALTTLKANIAKNGVDSIAAAQIVATTADKKALAYGIAANGKAVMASGEEMAALLKTNANYVSIMQAYEEVIETIKQQASNTEQKPEQPSSQVSNGCSSSTSGTGSSSTPNQDEVSMQNASDNTLTSLNLGTGTSYTYNNSTYTAYNSFISTTTGSNWSDAQNFVALLNNANDGVGYNGHNDWQLLSSKEMAYAWWQSTADTNAPTNNNGISVAPDTFGGVSIMWSSESNENNAPTWRCGYAAPSAGTADKTVEQVQNEAWISTPQSASTSICGFVVQHGSSTPD